VFTTVPSERTALVPIDSRPARTLAHAVLGQKPDQRLVAPNQAAQQDQLDVWVRHQFLMDREVGRHDCHQPAMRVCGESMHRDSDVQQRNVAVCTNSAARRATASRAWWAPVATSKNDGSSDVVAAAPPGTLVDTPTAPAGSGHDGRSPD
jgi:hypothetical protein